MALSIQPQLPNVIGPAAAATAALLKPGQVLEATVIGKTPEGLTALKIGDVVINAQLPQALPAGTTLQVQVKAAGPAPQLVLVGTPQLPANPPPVQPVPVLPLPTVPNMPEGQGQVAPAFNASSPVTPSSMAGSNAIAQSPAMTPPPTSPAPALGAPAAGAAPSQATAHAMPVVSAGASAPIAESPQAVAPVTARIESTSPSPQAASASPSAVPPVTTQPAPGSSPPSPAPSTATPTVGQALPAVTPSGVPGSPTSQQPAVVPSAPSTPASTQPQVPGSSPVTVTAQTPQPAPTTHAVAQPTVQPAPAAPPVAAAPVTASQPQTAPAPPTSPSAAGTPIAAASTVANASEPVAPSPLLVAQGAARPALTVADLPKAAQMPASAMAQPSALPATPAAALAQMIPEALGRQNSIAPLLASLAAIVAKPGGLPDPVLRAVAQVLGQRVQVSPAGPTAQLLETAVAKSGVYLEAALAKGAPAADLKSGLVALKGALATFLGGNPAPVTASRQAAPPLRGMPPRVDAPDVPPLPEAPREAARALHSQADAALLRVKLLQLASLPDADATVRAQAPELRVEVPFFFGQELVMAQFQVFRDGARRQAEGKRGWTMRFAMNFAAAGEVGAEVGLLGRSVNVALWAADRDTAAGLEGALPELAPALAAIGLEPGAVRVRSLPPDTPKPASGHYLDSRR